MIDQFYRDNYDRLVNQIARKCGGDKTLAEDVVQEAFLKATKFFPVYDEHKGKFSSWFNVILYNVLRDVQDFNKSIVAKPVDDISSDYILNYDDVLSNIPYPLIKEKLSYVRNTRHRECLTMFFVYGFTSKEISFLIDGMTQSNVTTIVERFKKGFV